MLLISLIFVPLNYLQEEITTKFHSVNCAVFCCRIPACLNLRIITERSTNFCALLIRCNLVPQPTHQTHFYTEDDGEEPKRTFELHRCCQGRVKCVYSTAVLCADQTLCVRKAALCGNETCIESVVLMYFMEGTEDM
jgi:hypothetical protein